MVGCDSYTWHRKLGHINLNALKNMRDGAVIGINFKDDGTNLKNCEICCSGKMSRRPFGNNGSRATKILEIIHSDLAGPMENQSIGKAKYLLTFIDDFSRKTFVYFLKSKGEVLTKFKEFKSSVENQTGQKIQNVINSIDEIDEDVDKNKRTIKKLRTDNGGQYLSNEFIDFCKRSGIQHQKTNVYTPQQNGLAERMNRTIIEKAKCLLFDADLPKYYWGEASHMAATIINKSVNSSGKLTPDEVFYGIKPDLTNFEIFGSECMVHIPEQKRKKWDKKAVKLIFVGYDDDTKGFRCIDPQTRKLTISRDVKFLSKSGKVTLNIDDNKDKNSTKHECK